MSFLKRLLSLTLVLCFLLLCIGCNNTDNTQETTPVTEGSSSETTEAPETSDDTTDTKPVFKVPESIKILAIGNSFSDDAMAYLWDILKDAGCKEVIVANVYKGGCDLYTHYNNIKNNKAAYIYKKNENGTFKNTENATMLQGLNDEKWDYITLQQASGSSGSAATYANLKDVVKFVKNNNPDAKLFWHMTWAYQGDSTHNDFAAYGKNQMQMYNSICSATRSKIENNKNFYGMIPAGTTIQNMRTSYVGDNLTRDGYHMSYEFGRYSVALTWAATILGEEALEKIDWVPPQLSSLSDHRGMIDECIKNALASPYQVTPSTYTKQK